MGKDKYVNNVRENISTNALLTPVVKVAN
jgi:hypothetical protein